MIVNIFIGIIFNLIKHFSKCWDFITLRLNQQRKIASTKISHNTNLNPIPMFIASLPSDIVHKLRCDDY